MINYVSVSPTLLITALTLLSIRVTTPSLSLAIKYHHLALPPQDLITPIASKDHNLVVAVTMEITDLQRRVSAEFCKDSRAPLGNLFLIVIVKNVPSGSS